MTAQPNPITTSGHTALGATTVRWESTETEAVEVRVGGPDGPLFSRTAAVGVAPTGDSIAKFDTR